MTFKRLSRPLAATLAAIGVLAWSPAARAVDLGVSIQFSQPGVYGRVDIGQYPEPRLIGPQAIMVAPPPPGMAPPEAVYLWVPPEHREHWARHCREYHACGHPVYFVEHGWYQDHVMAHRGRDEGRHDNGRHEGRRDERDGGRERDRGRGDDQR